MSLSLTPRNDGARRIHAIPLEPMTRGEARRAMVGADSTCGGSGGCDGGNSQGAGDCHGRFGLRK